MTPIRKAAHWRERIPAGQWVTAQGYDHNLLSERRHPDRLCLDAAAPDNPVVICHQSGHMGVFNTAALERLGVTAQTPAPAGGVIGRENGTLTGYMEENAFLEFQKRVPMRPLESFLAAYRKAQDLMPLCCRNAVKKRRYNLSVCLAHRDCVFMFPFHHYAFHYGLTADSEGAAALSYILFHFITSSI